MENQKNGDAQMRIPYPNPLWSRRLSMLLAIILSVLILLYPHAIASSISEVNHSLFNLLMWGIAIGFIHGVGFVPHMTVWRIVFHPFLGWLLMAFGITLLLSQS